jgi:hypothetical protein
MSDHLTVTTGDRGLKRSMPAIPGDCGGSVRVHESRAAMEPHVWLAATGLGGREVFIHLTAENAWKLAEQLQHLVRNHHQGDATPDWAAGKVDL